MVSLLVVSYAFLSLASEGLGHALGAAVHANVHRALKQCGRINVIVSFQASWPADVLDSSGLSHQDQPQRPADRGLRSYSWELLEGSTPESASAPVSIAPVSSQHAACGEAQVPNERNGSHVAALMRRLESYATQTHRPVHQVVEAAQDRGIRSSSLWITNQVAIRNATRAVIDQLEQLPSVRSIVKDHVLPVPSSAGGSLFEDANVAVNSRSSWGIELVEAPKLWAQGITGQDVIVGVMDTGVRGSHRLVRDSYVGTYGWYDGVEESSEPDAVPHDELGHGTAVLSIIVGKEGLGMAPDSRWLACRACDDLGCEESMMIACAQYLMCPNRDAECSKYPHVVNLSLNDDLGMTDFAAIFRVFDRAGIIAVVPTGNSGPQCKSVLAPADSASFAAIAVAVGATDQADALARFSGRGPGIDNAATPHLTAPGKAIPSADVADDENVKLSIGTSMAVPHVTGAIALLRQAFPGHSAMELISALKQSAATESLKPLSQSCGRWNGSEPFPNYDYGHGRLNVYEAYRLLARTGSNEA